MVHVNAAPGMVENFFAESSCLCIIELRIYNIFPSKQDQAHMTTN